MQLGSHAQIPDGLLAEIALLREKPHQGVPSRNLALHQGIDEHNSTAALGLRASLLLKCVGSSYTKGNILFPDSEEASYVEIRIPDVTNSLRAFTRDVTTVFDGLYSRTSQIIQLTEWTLGTADFDQVGWKTCELMRRAYGEPRSLEVACAHVFRFDEEIEVRALLMQIFVNQWSAILAPVPITFFISIDEEYLKFHLHDAKVAKYVSEKLARWSPQLNC